MDFTAKCLSCHQDKNLQDLWSESEQAEEDGTPGSYGQTLVECFGLSEGSKICRECVQRMRQAETPPTIASTEIVVKIEPWFYAEDSDAQLENDIMDQNDETTIIDHETLGQNDENFDHDTLGQKDETAFIDHDTLSKEQTLNDTNDTVQVAEAANGTNEIAEDTVAANEDFNDIVKAKEDLCSEDFETGGDATEKCDEAAKGRKHRGRRPKYTNEEMREVLDAVIQKKMTSKQAEEKLNCARHTLRRWLQNQGYKRPKYVPKYTEEELADVVEQVVQRKMSCNQALARLQCSRRVLKREFQKIGFKPTASAFQPYSTEQLKEVLVAVTSNRVSFAEALEALPCSRQTLRRRLDEFIATGDIERHARPKPRLKSREIDDDMKQIFDDVANQRMPVERAKVLLGCGQETLKKKMLEMYGFDKPAKTPTRNESFVSELQTILRLTNATPFKMTPGKLCACAYCPYPNLDNVAAEQRGKTDELRLHVQSEHAACRVEGVVRMVMSERLQIIKLDVAGLRCEACSIDLNWSDMFSHLETVHSATLKESRSRLIPFHLTTKQLMNCVLCTESFTSLNLVNHHMNTHYTEHTCRQCNTTFMSAILLKTHERTAHSTFKNFPCESCGKEFKNRNSLVKHVYNTHGKGRTKHIGYYTCSECGQKFHANQKLRQHIIDEHEGNLTYSCEFCPDKTFVRRSSYLKHFSLLHKGLKYECKLCDKKFHLPCLLRDHEDWHNDHEDYVCKTCGAKFVSKDFAKLHRRKHTEVVRFDCQLCESKFKSKSGLNKHLATQHQQQFLRSGGKKLDKQKTVSEAKLNVPSTDTSKPKRKLINSVSAPTASKRKSTDSVPATKAVKRKPTGSATSKTTEEKNIPTSKSKRKAPVKSESLPVSNSKTIPNRALVKSLRVFSKSK